MKSRKLWNWGKSFQKKPLILMLTDWLTSVGQGSKLRLMFSHFKLTRDHALLNRVF